MSYDGTIADEPEFLVMGGQAEAITASLRQTFRTGLDLSAAVAVAVHALGSVGGEGGATRTLIAEQLEVAVLDRTRTARMFKRLTGAALTRLLPSAAADETDASDAPADTAPGDEAPAAPTPAAAAAAPAVPQTDAPADGA